MNFLALATAMHADCAQAAGNVTLTVDMASAKSGMVISAPDGIVCNGGSTCPASFPAGTQVEVVPAVNTLPTDAGSPYMFPANASIPDGDARIGLAAYICFGWPNESWTAVYVTGTGGASVPCGKS